MFLAYEVKPLPGGLPQPACRATAPGAATAGRGGPVGCPTIRNQSR